MGAFSAEWLALREPVDHIAINVDVRRRLQAWAGDRARVMVVDLGSGTGSNFRSLAGDLPCQQNWLLVDHDAALLATCRDLLGTASAVGERVSIAVRQADLSAGDIDDLVARCDLVTAAALFDLVSPAVIERIVAAVAQHRAAFYATLIYDGVAAWLPFHDLDRRMLAAFNAHQRTDKGFGCAAGPDAAKLIAGAFETRGYAVWRRPSPWVLSDDCSQLRIATDRGWAQAARETDQINDNQQAQWLAWREAADQPVTIVGHQDVLALPPAT